MENYEFLTRVIVYVDDKPVKTANITNMQLYALSDKMIQVKQLGEVGPCLTTSARHKSDDLLSLFKKLRRLSTPKYLAKSLTELGFGENIDIENFIHKVDGKQTLSMELCLHKCSIEGTKAKGLNMIKYRLMSRNPRDFSSEPITDWVKVYCTQDSTVSAPSEKAIGAQESEPIQASPIEQGVNQYSDADVNFQLAAQFSVLRQFADDYTQHDFAPVAADIVRLNTAIDRLGILIRRFKGDNTYMLTVYYVVCEITNLILKSATIEKSHFELLGRVIKTFDIVKLINDLHKVTSLTAQA